MRIWHLQSVGKICFHGIGVMDRTSQVGNFRVFVLSDS
jgi:hypothetical protein